MNKSKQRLFEMMAKLNPSFKHSYLLVEGDSMLGESVHRTMYRDILKLFQENDLRTTRFITIGYANAVDIKKRIFPTDSNEGYARELIENAKKFSLSDVEVQLISDFINSEDWTKTRSGEILYKSGVKKNTPKPYFDINPKYLKIVRFARYQFNFQDREKLAGNFADRRKGEIELRKKYGFGRDEETYPEDDWRRKLNRYNELKYKGLKDYPVVAQRDINKGSSYTQPMGDFPIFGDVDKEGNPRIDPKTNYQRMALKQNISTGMIPIKPDYFFIDEDGNLISVSERFVRFFERYLSEPKESAIEELNDEEKEFVGELNDLLGRHYVTQFLIDRLAFISATPLDAKTGEKKPIYFYNDDLDILENFKIDINQLKQHINKYIKDSFDEAE